MSAFITKFNSPHTLDELRELYENDCITSLEILLNDSEYEYTEWSVHKNAKKNDTVFFCCGPASINYMDAIYKQAQETSSAELIEYAGKVRTLHQKYSGKIVAVGYVADTPFCEEPSMEHTHWSNPWYAGIEGLRILDDPIDIADIRDIVVLQPHTVTMLTEEQEKKLNDFSSDIHDPNRDFAYRAIGMFDKYLELIFSVDVLWDRFQMYVGQEIDMTHFQKDHFAFHRDLQCIEVWRQMLDNMGGGFRLSLFAAMAFELLSYEAAGHNLDEELMQCTMIPNKQLLID